MNLVDGRILESRECEPILESLEQRILYTLKKDRLDTQTVISACHRLVTELDETLYLTAMADLGINESLGRSYIADARRMFCQESLHFRLRTELGENYSGIKTYTPLFYNNKVREIILPLGVLLHIAAGNADGLPVFSVLEGLLTGNINILKLPSAESGISISLLLELIKIEPTLAEYIYVFDYSSRDIQNIEKLISVADAVVVWGGDAAVKSLRGMVKPNIKLIEWGHKVSFGYVTELGMTDKGLAGLAQNIAATNQLLCSSCQGIFIDTDNMDLVYDFCKRFLPILAKKRRHLSPDIGIGIQSQVTIQVYSEELETAFQKSKVFKSDGCSLIAYPNKTIEPSIQFCNAWVKPLPKTELLSSLRPYKNHLQTIGLICVEEEREELMDLFFKTGVVHVCSGEQMSATYCGAAHDGEYSLRRYTKIVCAEY